MNQENQVITDNSEEPRELFTPWFLLTISTTVLILIAYFLSDNILWLRNHSFSMYDTNNLSYRSHTYFLYISSMRRSVGLFSGIALMFLGVGVSFYTIKSQTDLNISVQNFSLGLVTASPRIIAMTLGAFLVAHNTSSKDLIPIYGVVSIEKPTLSETTDILSKTEQEEK